MEDHSDSVAHARVTCKDVIVKVYEAKSKISQNQCITLDYVSYYTIPNFLFRKSFLKLVL